MGISGPGPFVGKEHRNILGCLLRDFVPGNNKSLCLYLLRFIPPTSFTRAVLALVPADIEPTRLLARSLACSFPRENRDGISRETHAAVASR